MKKIILALGIVILFATCKKDVPQKQLTVNVTPAVGGAVTPSTGTYALGTSVKVTANPSPEYIFKEWSGGFTGTTNPANVIMDADKAITAVFEKREYPLSLTIIGSGTVKEEIIKIASTATNYKSGTTIRLTPQPSVGFQFKKWSGDDTTSKSPLDLVVSKPINLTCTFEKMAITSLKIENPIDTLVISKKHKYIVKGVYTNGTTIDLSDSVKITASNFGVSLLTDKNIIGAKSGSIKVVLAFNDLSFSDDIYINSYESTDIHPFLANPVNGSKLIIPVVIINQVPTKEGLYINQDTFPVVDNANRIISNLKIPEYSNWLLSNDIRTKHAIEEGSKFRGFKDSLSIPYIGIKVIKIFNFYEMDVLKDNQTPDYTKIFEKINMKELVEVYGVKEIWFNNKSLGLPESNMSSKLTGDISNSTKIQNDLPIYSNTYVVYGNFIHRWYAENIHNRGHQIEAQLAYLDNTFFWQDFVGYPKGAPKPYFQGGRCGSTHYTPNSTGDYDYDNKTLILSDIGDWNPNNNGVKKMVNINDWQKSRNLPVKLPTFSQSQYWSDLTKANDIGWDPQGGWLIYWFQSIPSNKPIMYSQNGINYTIENWWDIFYNWDDAIKTKKKLYK